MELLRSWVNDELKLSKPVGSFEVDMANGFLLGEILAHHGLLRSMDALADKQTPLAKIGNFNAVQQPLLDLGVKFDSNIANSIMTEKKGVATNLCYQLRLGLQSAKGSGKPVVRRGMAEPSLMGSTIKSNRAPLRKFEAMQSEHFDTLVRQSAQDPKDLAQALNLSKYTAEMIQQQQQAEEVDELVRARLPLPHPPTPSPSTHAPRPVDPRRLPRRPPTAQPLPPPPTHPPFAPASPTPHAPPHPHTTPTTPPSAVTGECRGVAIAAGAPRRCPVGCAPTSRVTHLPPPLTP